MNHQGQPKTTGAALDAEAARNFAWQQIVRACVAGGEEVGA